MLNDLPIIMCRQKSRKMSEYRSILFNATKSEAGYPNSQINL